MNKLLFKQPYFFNGIIFIFFLILYGISVFGHHYFFGTFYLDLGLHTQPLWEYAHGLMAHFDNDPNRLMLSDHFSLSLILYAPLIYIFGSNTLLVVQLGFVFLGAWGILRYIKSQSTELYKYSPIILFFFLGHMGIILALGYDFHNNVPGAMLIPWLFLFYRQQRLKSFWTIMLLMVICQETIAVYTIGFLLTLSVEKFLKLRSKFIGKMSIKFIYNHFRRIEVPAFAFLLFYILFVGLVVSPALHTHQLSRVYGHLGNSGWEIINNLFTDPSRILIPYKQVSEADISTIFLGLMLISFGGLYLVFLQPVYLIALLVLFIPRYLSQMPVFWFQVLHYSIELSPLFTLAFIDFLLRMLKGKWKTKPVLIWGFLAIVSLCNIYASSRTKINYRIRDIYNNFHNADYVQRKELIEAIKLVPDDSSVLVPNNIATRLYKRMAGKLRVFYYDLPTDPLLKNYNGEYILFSFSKFFADTLLPDTTLRRKIISTRILLQKYIDSPDFSTVYHKKDVYLLRRIAKFQP